MDTHTYIHILKFKTLLLSTPMLLSSKHTPKYSRPLLTRIRWILMPNHHEILCTDHWYLTKKGKEKKKGGGREKTKTKKNLRAWVTAQQRVRQNEADTTLQESQGKPWGGMRLFYVKFVCGTHNTHCTRVYCTYRRWGLHIFRLLNESGFGNKWHPWQTFLSTEPQ